MVKLKYVAFDSGLENKPDHHACTLKNQSVRFQTHPFYSCWICEYLSLQEKMKEKTTFSEIKNCVRSTLEPYLYKKTHRNPIVIPVIINSRQTMEEIQQKRLAKQRVRKKEEA